MEHPQVPSYEKMPEETRRWGLGEEGFRALARVPWVVTEKIHGANLCFEVDAAGQRASCRSRWLEADDDFFGYRPVMARLLGGLRGLFDRLSTEGASRVLVYGELFGGRYPHPAVARVAGVEPIQTGIWYAPGVEFRAFDLATDGPAGKGYVPFERACALFAAAGVPHCRPLLVGSYGEAMAFSNTFTTTLPAELGLPPLDDNEAEGVVVKPWSAVAVRDQQGRAVRPILKRKIDKFAEDERYHQAERPAQAPGSEFEAMKQHASWLVNEPRLAAVRSKLGAVEKQGEAGLRLLTEAIFQDALASMAEQWGPRLAALGAPERARLESFLRDEAATLVELLAPPG